MITFDDILRLADSGNIPAMVETIQQFVWEMDVDFSEDPIIREKIMKYLCMAIEQGNATAMNQLGAMYAEGKWVEQDPEKAFLCYKKAAEHGHSLAMSNLGFCYLYGDGTEINYEEAYKTFSKAAVLGEGEAIVMIGDMYQKGLFVEKDPLTAYKMYVVAKDMAAGDLSELWAQQVYSDAQLRIGDCYYNGDGVEQNKTAAIRTYADALYYYELREAKGDFYSAAGYKRAKEKLAKAAAEIEV